MKTNHHYKILQVSPAATSDDIKRAFRKLAHLYHPDKTKNDTHLTAQFEQIKTAYEVLMDASLRSAYDAMLFAGFAGKGKSVAVDAASYFDKLEALKIEVNKSNANNLDYDWLYLSILSLLRSPGIQDAVLKADHERFVFDPLISLFDKLPYKEVEHLTDELLTVFNDAGIHEKWNKLINKKRLAITSKRYQILIILLLSLAIVTIIIISV